VSDILEVVMGGITEEKKTVFGTTKKKVEKRSEGV
jgi:hypothetical protein